MADLDFVHQYQPAGPQSDIILVLLHGTGGNENDLVPLAKGLMPEAGLLSLRGKVLENGSPRFFRRLAEGVFDQEDLRLRTNELEAFLIASRLRYKVPAHRLIAIGYSNGANIASSLILTHPHALSGAVLFRGMVPFQPEIAPDLTQVSILLCSGQRDPIVPRSNAEALAGIFTAAGADLKQTWSSGGHELSQLDIDTAKSWLVTPLA